MGYKKYMTKEEWEEYNRAFTEWAEACLKVYEKKEKEKEIEARCSQLTSYLKDIAKTSDWIEVQIYYQDQNNKAVYMDTFVIKYADNK